MGKGRDRGRPSTHEVSTTYKSNAYSPANDASAKRDKRRENWRTGFSVVAAITGALAAIYACRQWHEMQKQTIIQRNISIAAERALLTMKSGAIEFATISDGRQSANVDVAVKNEGKTPAKGVYAEAKVAILRNGEIWTGVFGDVPNIGELRPLMLPGDSIHLATQLVRNGANGVEPTTLTEADVAQFKEGRDIFVVYGRVTYRDNFDRWHWHHFCDWNPKSLGNATALPCATYNDMDETDLNDEGLTLKPPRDPHVENGKVVGKWALVSGDTLPK